MRLLWPPYRKTQKHIPLFPNLEQSLKETVEAAKTMAGSTNEKDDKGKSG